MGAAGSSRRRAQPCPVGRGPEVAPEGYAVLRQAMATQATHVSTHVRQGPTCVSSLSPPTPHGLASAPWASVPGSYPAGTHVRGERVHHRPGPRTASHTREAADSRIRRPGPPSESPCPGSCHLPGPPPRPSTPQPDRTRLGAVERSGQRALTALCRRRRRARLPAVPRTPLHRRVGSAQGALRPRTGQHARCGSPSRPQRPLLWAGPGRSLAPACTLSRPRAPKNLHGGDPEIVPSGQSVVESAVMIVSSGRSVRATQWCSKGTTL